MLTPRTLLRFVGGGVASALFASKHWFGEAIAAEGRADATISGLQVVRLREKGNRGNGRSYLEIM